MTSSFLEQPLRTESEAMADADRRRNLRILGEAAGDYEYQAAISENGGSASNASKFKDRAYAIRWAMDRLAAITEGPLQALASIGKAAE